MAAQRAARGETSQRMREAMKTGDDRYLPARDRGPVRRFIRDYVDSRFSFIELMVPLLVLSMILGYSGNTPHDPARQHGALHHDPGDHRRHRDAPLPPRAARWRAASPDEPTKGITFYAAIRSLQMKFLRLPKPQVKIGEKLPETYR